MRASISLLLLLSACASAASTVSIVRYGDTYSLLRNGQPYFVKGAVGAVHLEELAAAGGNSIRADVTALDSAQALGLTVLIDLPFGKQRWGFNYADPAAVNRQREQLRGIVEQYKGHPAVLAWALGNELEIGTTAAQRAVLWREIDACGPHDPRHRSQSSGHHGGGRPVQADAARAEPILPQSGRGRSELLCGHAYPAGRHPARGLDASLLGD
jgi:hypothetical protein